MAIGIEQILLAIGVASLAILVFLLRVVVALERKVDRLSEGKWLIRLKVLISLKLETLSYYWWLSANTFVNIPILESFYRKITTKLESFQ